MTIAVVILNWNGIDLLRRFLPDVIAYSPQAVVYVADNASTDDSVAFVRENYPDVKIIENKINGGYAKGYNDALALVPEDIFVLLNSDVQVTPGWLKAILNTFETDLETGAVQPKILDHKNPDYFEYAGAAGGFVDFFGYPYCRGRVFNYLEKDHGQYDDEREIFWASGACLAVLRDAYYRTGALDEDYFAHQEEIDLCWRLHNFGYKILYTPKSVVYHVGGATLSSVHPRKTFYNFRNSLYNLLKHVPIRLLLPVIFGRMILDGIAAFKFLFEGNPKHFSAVFKAHMDFYKNLGLMRTKRKKLPHKVVYFSKFSVVCNHYIFNQKKFSDL